jgi:hypothetical protein
MPMNSSNGMMKKIYVSFERNMKCALGFAGTANGPVLYAKWTGFQFSK